MKKKLLFCLFLITLSSCSKTLPTIVMNIGDRSITNDDISLCYSLKSTIKTGDKIKGYITCEENVDLDTFYYFCVSNVDPLLIKKNYQEIILLEVSQEDLQTKFNNSKYDKFSFEISIDINKLISITTKDEFTFIFHKANWSVNNIASYSACSYKYEFKNNELKVKELNF